MYRALAREPLRSLIPWRGVHLFWGDERCVPPHHPRSNFGMAWEAFVRLVPLPLENVHRMKGELSPEVAAAEYERELAGHFGAGPPELDLLHLGVGTDGHTASLFPGALEVLSERRRWVRAAYDEAQREARITLTPVVLNSARAVELLELGAEKAEILARSFEGDAPPWELPLALIQPRGEWRWLLTEAAARRLPPGTSLGERPWPVP
jgi:6-phosphogluconolactonase